MDTLNIVVPVRFSGGGLAMQTTTSRMSSKGAFVRCLVAPKEGAEMTLVLTLPSAARPVEVAGTITERVGHATQGKEAGFWVQFGSLSDDAREQLDGFLRSKGGLVMKRATPAPSPSDAEPAESQRAWSRMPTRLQVGWSSAREFLVAYSENISRGGIFVATPNPPPLREHVELLLELPDGKGPAKTYAEVVHRITAEEAKTRKRIAGAGLQFVGGDDEFRRRLDACIENLLMKEG
jgi:uncharacterized protein (TIGR02266 family)